MPNKSQVWMDPKTLTKELWLVALELETNVTSTSSVLLACFKNSWSTTFFLIHKWVRDFMWREALIPFFFHILEFFRFKMVSQFVKLDKLSFYQYFQICNTVYIAVVQDVKQRTDNKLYQYSMKITSISKYFNKFDKFDQNRKNSIMYCTEIAINLFEKDNRCVIRLEQIV